MSTRSLLTLLLLASSLTFAQTAPPKPKHSPQIDVPKIAAKPEDVSTLDGILKAY
jgi:hypothetical protein